MSTQKICLGVEINQGGLKIALVEPERRNVIKIDAVSTSGDSMNDTSIYSSVISSWTHNNMIPKINSVAVAFPVQNSIMRLVAIPKEVEHAFDYVEWEFASAINSNVKDYRLDVAFYPNAKKPERAIVTAMRKKIVDSFCSLELERSGFRPNCLIADICALLNLMEYSEGLDSQPKCVLKVDEKFAVAFWGNETGPLAIRLLPKDFLSPSVIIEFLEKGFKEFPKVKRNVKLCGELSANATFVEELANAALVPKESMEISVWKSLPKFSMEKSVNSSKLSQCLGAVGATLNCM
jgi:hypothetical protein